MDIKSLIPAILVVITFAFSIAACIAPQADHDNGSKLNILTAKGPGFDLKNSEYTCKKQRETMDAIAAFAIMACIVAGVATIIAILLAIEKFPGPKIVNVVLLILVAAFSLVSWAIMAHAFQEDFCNFNMEKSKFELAAGFACSVVTTGMAIISLILSLVLGGNADGVKPVE